MLHRWTAWTIALSFVWMGAAGCGSPESNSTTGGGGAATTTTPSGGSGGAGGAAPTSAYDPAHVVEIVVSMDAADWDKLRFEKNDFQTQQVGDCLAGPKPSPYNYYPAQVTVDGQVFDKVDVRKKGALGSLSVSRPSLKVKLDAYDPAAHFFEAVKLTLNNGKQDETRIRTCLAFEAFADAGVPAPRCSFAHVTVNGNDLGVYSNIESVDDAALGNLFGDATGNLYEGVISDFRADWQDTYEKKTNQGNPDRSDLQALTDALLAPDADLLAQVEPLVDVDKFLTFWAAESMLNSWDGYTGGQNNHFVYHDPTSGKLQFVPWGPDATFSADNPFSTAAPLSVLATSALPNRLYGLPDIRDQYRTRLLELVDKTFTKGRLLTEVDRMEALLGPFLDGGDGAWKAEVDGVRQFVKDRPGALQAEVAGGPVDYPFSVAGIPCSVNTGSVSATFSTTMGTIDKNNPFGTGDGTIHLVQNGMPVDTGNTGAAAGMISGYLTIAVIGFLPTDKMAIVSLQIDPSVIKAPADLPIDSQQVIGVYGTLGANSDFQLLSWLDGGTVHLDKVGLNADDEIVGTLSSDTFGPQP